MSRGLILLVLAAGVAHADVMPPGTYRVTSARTTTVQRRDGSAMPSCGKDLSAIVPNLTALKIVWDGHVVQVDDHAWKLVLHDESGVTANQPDAVKGQLVQLGLQSSREGHFSGALSVSTSVGKCADLVVLRGTYAKLGA